MSNTKKIALMSTLVLLLAVTAIFNFVLAGTRSTQVSGSGVQQPADYFTTYRTERNTTRSEEFLQLDSVIAAYAQDSAEYREAVAEKQKMVEIMEDELVLETIIKSLGFSDAVVAIGSDSGNVNVFINSDELSEENNYKIRYALEQEQMVYDGNIIIIPVYAES